MAKLTGMNEAKTAITNSLISSLEALGEEIVKEVESNLKSNQTANGNSQPTKKPSTKKQYAKKGWDRDNWLIRTGKSTELNTTVNDKTVTVKPRGAELLFKRFRVQAEAVFTLTQQFRTTLINKLKDRLSKEFK